jgi:hypothetical protein
MPCIVASGDLLYLFCSNDAQNYTLNSTFENNLMNLLLSLPSKTSVTGFNSTSFGDASNKVYVEALCRGDVNSTACNSCVKKASQEIIQQCKREEAVIWFELCQVHYSSRHPGHSQKLCFMLASILRGIVRRKLYQIKTKLISMRF